jgi:hypothetical protein
MPYVGIIHVHSNLSYDGQHPLKEIAAFAKERGYSYVGITEHSTTFDEIRMAYLVAECRSLSDPTFCLIPGLEFTCEADVHLVGLGVEHFTDVKEPMAVARFIKEQGGVAIFSHPSRYAYKIPLGLATELHGIEIWNAGYDGRFVPNDRSIALWRTLRTQNKALWPFGGQDLHQITDHCHVEVTVLCQELSQAGILQALRSGNFEISNRFFRLRPLGLSNPLKLHSIIWTRRAYLTAKAVRDCLAG